MEIFSVQGLNKAYSGFSLKDVSFSLDEGFIMGFIGRNGAGKTTTIKSMLGLVHRDGGEVRILGKDFNQNEMDLKQEIGYMIGGVDYYPKTSIGNITQVAKRFYRTWDQDAYEEYLRRFNLSESKRPSELSQGMRIKYSLVLALSHGARLLILDEPTSGLDPVARDDLLGLFQELVEDGRRSILFSTHITSDLEKCADYLTFIDGGQIIDSGELEAVLDSYRLIKGRTEQLETIRPILIASKTHAYGFTGLVKTADVAPDGGLLIEKPSLEDIMVYYAKKGGMHESVAV